MICIHGWNEVMNNEQRMLLHVSGLMDGCSLIILGNMIIGRETLNVGWLIPILTYALTLHWLSTLENDIKIKEAFPREKHHFAEIHD